MSIKYILLDFDGTIGNTNELVNAGLKTTVEKYCGNSITDHDIFPIMGRVLSDQMRYFCRKFDTNQNQVAPMMDFYREYYRVHEEMMSHPFPGVRETLQTLKGMNKSIAIVSSKGKNGILHGLEIFQIAPYIDGIVSAYDATHSKPHAEPVLKALDLLHGRPEDALMVGDSPYDIESGINAGTFTGLVKYTSFPSNCFENLKIDYLLGSFSDLIRIAEGDS